MHLAAAVRVLAARARRRAGLAELAVAEPVLLEAQEAGLGVAGEVALLEAARADELLVRLALLHARRHGRVVVGGAVGVGAVAELVEGACLGAGGEEEGGDDGELHGCCFGFVLGKECRVGVFCFSLQG